MTLPALPSRPIHLGAPKTPERFPPVTVYHVNFARAISLRLYDEQGRMQAREVRRIEELLRCHHTGLRHRLHPRLLGLIYRIARHYPARRVEIVAGYRAPSVARQKGAPRSNHMLGRAIDLRIPGVPNEQLRDYLRRFERVGLGYYPNSTFVHLDVRDDRSVYWVDWSGPGERPRYGNVPPQPDSSFRSYGASRPPWSFAYPAGVNIP